MGYDFNVYFFIVLNTPAVSLINLGVDAHLCKLRDSQAKRFCTDELLL